MLVVRISPGLASRLSTMIKCACVAAASYKCRQLPLRLCPGGYRIAGLLFGYDEDLEEK